LLIESARHEILTTLKKMAAIRNVTSCSVV